MNKKLSHLDDKGNPGMVDVGHKHITKRSATAQALIEIGEEVMSELISGDFQSAKGPVLDAARLAGTMAVKQTSQLIPLCHPLPINGCAFDISVQDPVTIRLLCTVNVDGKTGVEMEALTGASVAALTIYDMCKAISHEMRIKEIRLIRKTGGKSDYEAKTP
jgi:cyclic pyranopterin phosphate synthase